MQKIKKFHIKSFKGVYPEIEIDLEENNDSKNLVIYGENGSGKTSIMKAIFLLLEASNQDVQDKLKQYKNIFSSKEASIEVIFDDNSSYLINETTSSINDPLISAIFKTKSFLSYKDIMKIYQSDVSNLYPVLVDDILANELIPPENKFTFNEAYYLVKRVEQIESLRKRKPETLTAIEKDIIDEYRLKSSRKSKALNYAGDKALKDINTALEIVLEKIKPDINKFIKDFGYDFELDFIYENLKKQELAVTATMKDFCITTPNTTFNEAKLTAISISIYFAFLKNYKPINAKLLFLDDILIGMDLGHRIPILKILDENFNDYQIFLFTYDYFWNSVIKKKYEDGKKWKFIKILNSNESIQKEEKNNIQKSEEYLNKGDYKASVVYLRTEFEYILRRYAKHKKSPIRIKYIENPELYKTDDFWNGIKNFKEIKHLKHDIEFYRKNVLNNSVHLLCKPEYGCEIRGAIKAVKELQSIISTLIQNLK